MFNTLSALIVTTRHRLYIKSWQVTISFRRFDFDKTLRVWDYVNISHSHTVR